MNDRLRRVVVMDILHGLSPTHPECPPNRVRPTTVANQCATCSQSESQALTTPSPDGTRSAARFVTAQTQFGGAVCLIFEVPAVRWRTKLAQTSVASKSSCYVATLSIWL